MKKNLNEIVREKSKEIIEKDNVVGVGVGKKNGNGAKSVVVLVQKKLPENVINANSVIPSEIDGYKTDVIEVGEIFADSLPRKKKTRPVYAGASAIWEGGTACTFGGVVYKKGKAYGLMNTHCCMPFWKGAKVGDNIIQPSRNDGGRKRRDVIGKSTADYHHIDFTRTPFKNFFDSGLVELSVDEKELYLEDYGKIKHEVKDVKVGEVITKSGRTTGTSSAKVILTNATVSVNYDGQIALFNGQIITENKDRSFSQGGDSSSLVVNKDGHPVAQLFASSDKIGIVSPMKPIQKKFGFSFSPDEEYVAPIKKQYIFNNNLKKGDDNAEVVELQERLRDEGYFTFHTSTGYFGTITEEAVRKYQCAKGIVCYGTPEKTGWGLVGKRTRASLNKSLAQPEIKELQPVVKKKAEDLLAIYKYFNQKDIIYIFESVRTPERQQELWEQGRSKAGKIITDAPAGMSYHQYGVAFDVVFLDSKGNPSWSEKHDWETLGKIGKMLGLEWGGDWKNADRPHFEFTRGIDVQDFLDGEVDYKQFNDINLDMNTQKTKTNGLLSQAVMSSSDPEKLSLTVKGLLLAFVPIVLSLMKIYGIEGIDETLLTNLTESIVQVISSITGLVSVAMTTWGLVRKIWN